MERDQQGTDRYEHATESVVWHNRLRLGSQPTAIMCSPRDGLAGTPAGSAISAKTLRTDRIEEQHGSTFQEEKVVVPSTEHVPTGSPLFAT